MKALASTNDEDTNNKNTDPHLTTNKKRTVEDIMINDDGRVRSAVVVDVVSSSMSCQQLRSSSSSSSSPSPSSLLSPSSQCPAPWNSNLQEEYIESSRQLLCRPHEADEKQPVGNLRSVRRESRPTLCPKLFQKQKWIEADCCVFESKIHL